MHISNKINCHNILKTTLKHYTLGEYLYDWSVLERTRNGVAYFSNLNLDAFLSPVPEPPRSVFAMWHAANKKRTHVALAGLGLEIRAL